MAETWTLDTIDAGATPTGGRLDLFIRLHTFLTGDGRELAQQTFAAARESVNRHLERIQSGCEAIRARRAGV
jgi:hypothetical protein